MTLNRLKTVDYWLDNGYLNSAFLRGVSDDNVFEHIYVPITLPDSTGNSTTTWEDVGFDASELAEIYGNLYTGNYIASTVDDELNHYKISNKIKAVYNKNKYKYLKLIELMGYKYNPLFNVDGVELYGEFENQGVNDISSTTTGKVTNTNEAGTNLIDAPTTTHKVAPFDSDTAKIESQDVTSGKTTSTTEYGEQHGVQDPLKQETTVTHNNAKNIVSGAEVDYTVNAEDNVFGTALTGADKFHVDKRIRQGNIGVTKTQELIAAERENLKFNLFNVFYEDISEQILVGVYDY